MKIKHPVFKLIIIFLLAIPCSLCLAQSDEFIDQTAIIANTIMQAPESVAVIVRDTRLDSLHINQIRAAVSDVDDLENDPGMYFLLKLYLVDLAVERILNPGVISFTGNSVMIAGQTGEFTSIADGPEVNHQPPSLNNSGASWLLFLTKVKTASDLGKNDQANIARHLQTLNSQGLFQDNLYTIYKQQAGFLLSVDGAWPSLPLNFTDDISYIYSDLRSKLSTLKMGENLTEADVNNVMNRISSDIGRRVAAILLTSWRPGVPEQLEGSSSVASNSSYSSSSFGGA